MRSAGIALLALLLLTGCLGLAGNPDMEMPLDFEVWDTRADDRNAPDQSAIGLNNQIQFAGAFGTPNPCYNFDASSTIQNGTISIMIDAERRSGFCIMVVGSFGYEGTLENVPSGSYDFVVMLNRDNAEPRTILEAEVQVN